MLLDHRRQLKQIQLLQELRGKDVSRNVGQEQQEDDH